MTDSITLCSLKDLSKLTGIPVEHLARAASLTTPDAVIKGVEPLWRINRADELAELASKLESI